MNALILLFGAIAITTLYYFWPYNYWKKRNVKTLRPNVLFGNLSGVVLRKTPVYRMFKEVYERCKESGDKFMGFYFLNVPTLVITHPELMKQILIKDFSYFKDREFYLDEKDPLTVNVASAKGNHWNAMRDQLTPAFSPSKMKYVCHTLLQVSDQLKSVLDKSAENYEVVNLKDVIGRFMADAIGMGIFGIECNTLNNMNIEFQNFAENTFGGSFSQNIKLMLSLLCPSVLYFFKVPFSSTEVQKFYLNLVKTTVEYREKNNVVRNDLMHSMIQLRNNINIKKEGSVNLGNGNVLEIEKSLKIEEITAHALFFFGAAYETSSTTTALCMYELASNVDVQNTLRKEIISVFEKHKGKIDYDIIMEMTYLDKCVSETLRKHAIAAMAARTCTKRYQIPDTDIVVDVGTTVYLPIYEFHHDSDYFPNPEKFDPERFSSENKLKRLSYTYVPFGEGKRNCLGARLAILQVKLFLITFLRNYNFTINSKVKLPAPLTNSNIIVCLKYPLYMNIQKI